jgi:hypothetical protein
LREARIEARKGKGKGEEKEAVREPATGANTEPVAPRTILKRLEVTRWETMQLLKRWGFLLNDINDIIRILETPSVIQTPPIHSGLTPRRVAQVPILSPR